VHGFGGVLGGFVETVAEGADDPENVNSAAGAQQYLENDDAVDAQATCLFGVKGERRGEQPGAADAGCARGLTFASGPGEAG
jgi:hypothetical protein